MDRDALIGQLRGIIETYLQGIGIDLIEIIYRREGRDLVLRLLVDKPEGGISLGDCSYINKQLGEILDKSNILQERYILEVSSPGLDRPLKEKSDFKRCLNRRVRIFLNEPLNEKLELEGIITEVKEDSIYIDARGEIIEIPLSRITKAKQILNNI